MGSVIGEATLWFAVVALGLHLLTDARKLLSGLALRHRGNPCPHCRAVSRVAKEAWWEALALSALVAHLASDLLGWGI